MRDNQTFRYLATQIGQGMKKIVGYLSDYFFEVEKRLLVLSALFAALAIFINYYFGLNNRIVTFAEGKQLICWYFVFLTAFSFPYFLGTIFKRSTAFNNGQFVVLLLLAPALFAWKMAFYTHFKISDNLYENAYWNHVIYWPFKLLIFFVLLYVIWKLFDRQQPFYGLQANGFKAKPYFIMVLLMVPLLAAASTQPDFLAMYPKAKSIQFLSSERGHFWQVLLYELSYGTDFFSIELFFRGFLILAFAKWVGKDAILPMACFYCTIHFGKPLGECISSFIGGIILGVVTANTRIIYGGLIVHLGIAWLMELGGYLGNAAISF